MSDAGLAAKTIGTYIVMAKQIVESLADDDGQPIVPRKWDNDRIDLPIVNKREQRRVSLTAIQIETLIAVCEEEWERVLYILACASGLRISEALALDREHLSDDCSVIYVRQQVKANKIVACLKTDALGVTWTLILESLRFSVSTWAFALACYFRRGPIRRARTRIPITVASGRSLRSSVFMSQERELIASADSALPS
jgi:integrase